MNRLLVSMIALPLCSTIGFAKPAAVKNPAAETLAANMRATAASILKASPPSRKAFKEKLSDIASDAECRISAGAYTCDDAAAGEIAAAERSLAKLNAKIAAAVQTGVSPSPKSAPSLPPAGNPSPAANRAAIIQLQAYLTSLKLPLKSTARNYAAMIGNINQTDPSSVPAQIAALKAFFDKDAAVFAQTLPNGSNLPAEYLPTSPGIAFYNGIDLYMYVPKAPAPTPLPPPAPTP